MIKLFSDIFITRGYKRSVLQDLSRNEYYFIPHLLDSIIKKYNGKVASSDIQQIFHSKHADTIKDYYSFLYDKELIFDIDEQFFSNFPPINTIYEYPYNIINVSIFFSKKNIQNIKKVFMNNVFLNVITMQFFIPNCISFKNIECLIDAIYSKSTISIQIDIGKGHNDFDKFHDLSTNHALVKVVSHDSEITAIYLKSKEYRQKYPFLLNHYMQYFEATEYNTYLNKRLYIDQDGLIKLTPTHDLILGTIDDLKTENDLAIVAENIDYKNICLVHRGMIEVCKDCELRMMCIDDNVPMKNGNFWKLEKECPYNPYICKWKNEKDYVPVKECGTYNKKVGFIQNKTKIAKLNKQIWR